mmetsp:Transcript_9947/g.12926  ORF Transcript_9947/g.12926 Transcript_9947/m.12926 type:complete len:653 (+) Transcript_9947:333-2291(+)
MELTLTGGTLVDPLRNEVSSQQQTSLASPEVQQQQQQTSSLSTDAHSHRQHGPDCQHHDQHRNDVGKVMEFSIPVTPEERKKMLFELLQIKMARVEDFKKLLHFIVQFGEEDMLHSWTEQGHSLAHWAAKRHDVLILDMLLPYKIDLNQQSKDGVEMYPIHWATTEGSIKVVSWLIKHSERDIVNVRDGSGCTPLMIAAQYGYPNLVAYLIQKGADPSSLDNNRDSALHWGAYKGDSSIVGLLHHLNATDVDAVDNFGQTPLHLAAIRGMSEVVQYLLYDANSNAVFLKDKEGKTPLDLAIKKNRKSVQLVIESYLSTRSEKSLMHFLKQMCSPKEWKMWLKGGGTGDVAHGSNNRFPFILNISSTLLGGLLFPMRFFVPENYNRMADRSGILMIAVICYCIMLFFFFMVYTRNPGVLDVYEEKSNRRSRRLSKLKNNQQRGQHWITSRTYELSNLTKRLQQEYKEAVERMGIDGGNDKSTQLCHSCHIIKPYRSKHCRIMRRCVLMFDHYCPFVGNCIGLYNYAYFYFYCLFFVIADASLVATSVIYLRRVDNDLFTLIVTIYVGLYIIPSGFMVFYHSGLILKNLTTNEQENAFRYSHFRDPSTGRIRNPFDQGYLRNILLRFFPSEETYQLPGSHLDERIGLLGGSDMV